MRVPDSSGCGVLCAAGAGGLEGFRGAGADGCLVWGCMMKYFTKCQARAAYVRVFTLLLLLGIVPAADAGVQPDHKGTKVISNGPLSVEIMIPGHSDAYNTGMRFTPLAAVLSAKLDGYGYLYNPVSHDRVNDHAGLAAEFDLCIPGDSGVMYPPGYEEAEPGGGFVKVGVGVLAKPSAPYTLFSDCKALFIPETSVEWRRHGARFTQECRGPGGYGYRLEADVVVGTNRVDVLWSLANTGVKRIRTRQYTHNFVRFGDNDVGSGYVLSFPYGVSASGLEEEQVCRGNEIVFLKPVPKWANISVPYPADYCGQNTCCVKFLPEGRSITFETSRSGVRTDVHVRPDYVSPESFIFIEAEPGETAEWRRGYVFGR